MHTIFVGGVHAVGKSTCCELASAVLGIPHYSASSIIRSRDANAVALHSKSVQNVTSNQKLLIEGVQTIFASGVEHIILDGHFYVPNANGMNEPVPLEIFAALHVDCIVVYEDNPASIRQRRLERDGVAPTVEQIKELQSMEIGRSLEIARRILVPMKLLGVGDHKGLSDTARLLWKHRE